MPPTYTPIVASATREMSASTMLSDDQRALLRMPPVEWFTEQPDVEHAFTVDADGRCSGIVAYFGSNHIGANGQRIEPPRTKLTDPYSVFHGERPGVIGGPSIICANGEQLNVGRIVIDSVHPDLAKSASDAAAHYADTGAIAAVVRAYECPMGIAVAGAVHPSVNDEQLFTLRSADVSGDWRYFDDTRSLEMVGLLSVPIGGFQKGLVASGAAGAAPGRWALAASGGQVVSLIGGSPRHNEAGALRAAHGRKLDAIAHAVVASGVVDADRLSDLSERGVDQVAEDDALRGLLQELGIDPQQQVDELLADLTAPAAAPAASAALTLHSTLRDQLQGQIAEADGVDGDDWLWVVDIDEAAGEVYYEIEDSNDRTTYRRTFTQGDDGIVLDDGAPTEVVRNWEPA